MRQIKWEDFGEVIEVTAKKVYGELFDRMGPQDRSDALNNILEANMPGYQLLINGINAQLESIVAEEVKRATFPVLLPVTVRRNGKIIATFASEDIAEAFQADNWDTVIESLVPLTPSGGPGTNTGHGHIWERPDGVRARCGGPGMCRQCALDRQKHFPGLTDSMFQGRNFDPEDKS